MQRKAKTVRVRTVKPGRNALGLHNVTDLHERYSLSQYVKQRRKWFRSKLLKPFFGKLMTGQKGYLYNRDRWSRVVKPKLRKR